jgi:putative spermidine/putrescine transport system substrate-binding protein
MSLRTILTAAGICLSLTICSASAQTGATAHADLQGNITVMAYSGIFQDNFVQTVVEPFRKLYPNVAVTYAPSTNSATILGSARAQKADAQVDVFIMDVTTSTLGNTEGLFTKISAAEVPALNDLDAEARAAGGEYGPGVTYDHFIFVYDTHNLTPPFTSVKDLWRQDLKGLVALTAPPNLLGLALTAIVERMEGGDYRVSVDRSISRLKELAPSVQTFEPNPDSFTLILNGIVKVAMASNARAQLYADQSQGRIGVVLPPEGSVFQVNTINVAANSKNKGAALAFVNYALGQTAQKAFAERMFYAPTNSKVSLSPAALARTAASPENRARMIPMDWQHILKVRDQWNQRWRREVIAGSAR